MAQEELITVGESLARLTSIDKVLTVRCQHVESIAGLSNDQLPEVGRVYTVAHAATMHPTLVALVELPDAAYSRSWFSVASFTF